MNYTISPKDIPDYQKEAIKNTVKGGGLGDFPLIAFFVLPISGSVMSRFVDNGLFDFIFGLFASVVIFFILDMRSKAIIGNKLVAIELDKNVKAASSLQDNLNYNLQETNKLKSDLPTFLRQASDNLERAEFEYKENAYGPFWDAVEQAAQHLAQFNDGASKLKHNTTFYYHALDNVSNHTFPLSYPLQMEDVPETRPVLNELSRVIRLGQTNYQFANIWEQRRTRQVLIAGFKTLGEALNNLGSVIESSMNDLRTSISANMSALASEQAKTRESLEGFAKQQKQFGDDTSIKLDNIQRKRKPLI